MSKIDLKIYIPSKLIVDVKVDKVVLPNNDKTLTVIDKRAPSIIMLDMGSIITLDANNNHIAEYYISAGVADVVNNTCTVLTEGAYDKTELSYERVHELIEKLPSGYHRWLLTKYQK